MDLKFKVGDIIRHNLGVGVKAMYFYKVIDIIFEERQYNNYGFNNSKALKNCYIIRALHNGNPSYFKFYEDCLYLNANKETEPITKKSSCPNCNEELVEKYSEWAGENIKKCNLCGWC